MVSRLVLKHVRDMYDKAGVYSNWITYLSGKERNNFLKTYIFYDALATYNHKDYIKDFFSKWSNPNNLLKYVHFDIEEDAYLAGVRALGIIYKNLSGMFF